ncbi:hypothetical protein Trydic_g2781 [Trypoxylus dichotomus]
MNKCATSRARFPARLCSACIRDADKTSELPENGGCLPHSNRTGTRRFVGTAIAQTVGGEAADDGLLLPLASVGVLERGGWGARLVLGALPLGDNAERMGNPKLVRKGVIIAINVKQYAPEFSYGHHKTNSVEYVLFKYIKIKYEDNEDCAGDYFCVKGETELKQSAHVQEYLPAKFKRFLACKFENSHLEGAVINKCPYGLENRLDSLRKAVRPFLKLKRINLKPIFLVQGSKGNAKNLLVSILADEFGLNFYKISSYEVSATAISQMEIKIKNAFFKAKLCAPCLFVINNFENFGKNHEGKFNERIVDYFKYELANNLTNNDPPIIVVCISHSKEIPPELARVFLEIFEFGAPDRKERAKILEWLLEEQPLKYTVNIEVICDKTHGFFYGDLVALVYHAVRNTFIDTNESKQITMDDVDAALDTMQANYSESMGAPKVPRVQWSDIGGLGDVKAEIIRTINLPLKHPELLKGSGLRRSGILLYGPPGTGKTLLAKAVATECGLCFLAVKGPELLNMYVGQSEQNVREVFDRAREASPCIIFFDELDSLAPNRGISGDSGGVMDRVVSQLLAEMDGLNKEATVFIIGATNRPDLIDPALLRPGRFDKLLYVGPAETAESKLSVLQALTKKFKLAENTNLEEIVTNCPENISGADFYGLCSSAWMSAARCMIEKIEKGELNKDEVSHENVIVSAENFMDALKTVKPSINPEDMRYFQQLKQEFSTFT